MYDVPELREVGQDDLAALQELIETDPGYTERVTGYPPGSSDALSLVMMLPDNHPEGAKVVLAAWEDPAERRRMAAVVDLLRGFPEDGCVFVGLLQVRWELQGLGVGRQVWQQTEAWLREHWAESARLRLAVVDTNARIAEPFWTKVGFAPTGETKPYRYDKLESTTRFFEKPL